MQASKIAIVGIAAQLPSGAHSQDDLDYQSLWPFLQSKADAYQNLDSISSPNPFIHETGLPKQGAFLKNVTDFDNFAFGISARDARSMPFAARRLMELSFLALLDAGINSRGRPVGCFMSGNADLGIQDKLNSVGSYAHTSWSLANRISYSLNITGPSVFIDTACSSTLTAFHLAVNSLISGDCDAAIVGGSQSNRNLDEWKNGVSAGIFGLDGVSKPFSEEANGFSRGEGCVVIVLKTLDDALRDRDHIYSVVIGTAIGSGGSHMPLYVPSPFAYQNCIRAAYDRAGKHPSQVDYYEAHATGTAIGDPNEANAAGELFSRERGCYVGSIKGNFGHLEMAAFLASLLKACHILEKGVIPPTAHSGKPSRNITWEKFNLRLPTENISLPCNSLDGKSLISISSVGHGGSFGHVLLESPPSLAGVHKQIGGDVPILYIVGGLTPKGVEDLCHLLLQPSRGDKDEVAEHRSDAVILCRAARQCPWRTYFVYPPSLNIPIPAPQLASQTPPAVGFVFSGQGAQHWDMGRQLFEDFPPFRDNIMEMDNIYKTFTGQSLLDTTGLFRTNHSAQPLSIPWPVEVIVPAIAMLQIALFDLLILAGVKPSFFIGHSAGETAIIYTSGAGSKSLAIEVAIARGRSMTCTERLVGGMGSFACSVEQVMKYVNILNQSHDGDSLALSCYNAPNSTTLAGPRKLLEKAVSLAKADGFYAQIIRTGVPGHSPMMEMCRGDYDRFVGEVFARNPGPHRPRIPVYSTAKPGLLIDEFTSEYFWANTRNPVYFSQAVSMALSACVEPPVVIELAAHPVLSSSVHACGVPTDRILCPMFRDKKPEPQGELLHLFQAFGKLATLGINTIDLTNIYGNPRKHGFPVKYPFRYRTIAPPNVHNSLPLGRAKQRPLSPPYPQINSTSQPILGQHVVDGESILPATAFIEIALEAGAKYLWDIEFRNILPVHSSSTLDVRFRQDSYRWVIESAYSSEPLNELPWKDNASGSMTNNVPNKTIASISVSDLWSKLGAIHAQDFYDRVPFFKLFGPSFKRVLKIAGTPSLSMAEVRGLTTEERAEGYILHPAILDACLHFLLHPDISRSVRKGVNWLPHKIETFSLYAPGPSEGSWISVAELVDWMPGLILITLTRVVAEAVFADSRVYDITVYSTHGDAVCSVHGLELRKRITGLDTSQPRPYFKIIYQPSMVQDEYPKLPNTFKMTGCAQSRQLLSALDIMALEIMRKTLSVRPLVGDQIDRQRYYQFNRDVLALRQPCPVDPSIAKDLSEKLPVYLEITERMRKCHRDIFRSSSAAVEALFRDDIMTRFYGTSNLLNDACVALTLHFQRILSAMIESGKKVIRIMEVGAGTGLLTRHLTRYINTLTDVSVEYVATDISSSLSRELAQSLPYNFITASTYDLRKSADEQGYLPHTFDIVVASHVLHVAPDLSKSLQSLARLLTYGGFLMAVELDGSSWAATPGGVWHDFVFGAFSEWFGFSDGREHCALSSHDWSAHLQRSGFTNVQTCVEETGGLDIILSAQLETVADDTQNGAEHHYVTYTRGQEMELQTLVAHLDQQASGHLYFLTKSGSDSNSAIGFVVSLAQELTRCSVRLAIFETEEDTSRQRLLVDRYKHLFESGEQVLYFHATTDAPLVRRVVPHLTSPSPSLIPPKLALDSGIEVSHRSSTNSSVELVLGQLATKPVALARVATPAGPPPVVVPLSCLNLLGIEHRADQLLAASVVSLIKLDSFSHSPSSHVLIALSNSNNSFSAALITEGPWTNIDTDVANIPRGKSYDIIITDQITVSRSPYIRRYLRRGGKLHVWDEQFEDLMLGYPDVVHTVISEALTRASASTQSLVSSQTHLTTIEQAPTPTPLAPTSVFHANGAYIILGGIGGLGIELALWLFEYGVRHIVLTSRRGSFNDDALSQKKVSYLRSQGAQISLVSSDATSLDDMMELLNNIHIPIRGVFILTMVLCDSLFVNQTSATFETVHRSKLTPLEVLSSSMDLGQLDFCVSFSSIAGTVGCAGQTNYSSACTSLDGATNRFPNAFSVAVPAILDAGTLINLDHTDYVRLSAGGICAQELFECITDGIRCVVSGDHVPSPLIPAIDWSAIHRRTRLGAQFRHLIVNAGDSANPGFDRPAKATTESLLRFVLEILDIPKEDFDAKRPLTSYGIDSIGAARLSNSLRMFAQISEMQVLGGITWEGIQEKVAANDRDQISRDSQLIKSKASEVLMQILGISPLDFDPELPFTSYGIDSLSASRISKALEPYLLVTTTQLLAASSWTSLLKKINDEAVDVSESRPHDLLPKEDPIVEIRGGAGVPLIFLHGLSGGLAGFPTLAKHFRATPLWAIHVTQGVPLDSMSNITRYYYSRIKAKRPQGPYRLAAYSATSTMGVALARLFEDAGDEVCQLAFVDHHPVLWSCPVYGIPEVSLSNPDFSQIISRGLATVSSLRKEDPSFETVDPYPNAAERAVVLFEKLYLLTANYHVDQLRARGLTASSLPAVIVAEMAAIKAPMSFLIAPDGILKTLPADLQDEWHDLGASKAAGIGKVYQFNGGHYGIMNNRDLASRLEDGWER